MWNSVLLLAAGLLILDQSHAQNGLEIRKGSEVVQQTVKLTGNDNADFVCMVVGTIGSDQNPGLKWYDKSNNEVLENIIARVKVYNQKGDYSQLKLNIEKIKEDDAGVYTCNGTVNGVAKTVSVRVQVTMPLVIPEDACPSSQNFVQGTSPIVKCQIGGQFDVTWYAGSPPAIVSSHPRYLPETEGLKILQINQTDEGEYLFNIQGDNIDSKTVRIMVRVMIPPQITTGPTTQDAVVGTESRMECRASGKPQPSYKWYKGEDTSNPLKGSRYEIDGENGIFIIKNVIEDDRGIYKCVADNNYDPTASATATLNVIVPPTIREFVNKSETEGSSATMTCIANGNPPPTITFKRESTGDIFSAGSQPNSNIEVQAGTPDLNNMEVTSRLIINDLKAEDKGFYSCIAKNSAPNDVTQRAYLTVMYKPIFDPALKTNVYAWPGNAGKMECISEGSPRPQIKWKKNNITDVASGTSEAIGNDKTKSVLEVGYDFSDESNLGTYTCVSSNDVGSQTLNFTVMKAVVPSQPSTTVKQTWPTATQLQVSIKYNPSRGPPPKKIQISWSKGNNPAGSETIIVVPEQKSVIAEIKNLAPSSTYEFSVMAVSDAGNSQEYNLQVNTPSKRNPYPVIIDSHPDRSNPTSYLLKWVPPNDGGEPITNYLIRYRKVTVFPDRDNEGNYKFKEEASSYYPVKDAGKMSRYRIENLEPDTYYQVEVTAKNTLGNSSPQAFIFRTEKAIVPPGSQSDDNNSGLPIGIVILIIIIAFLVLFIVVDVTCYFTKQRGVFKCIRDKMGSGAGADAGRTDADAEKGDPETEKLMSGKEEKTETEDDKSAPGDGPIPEEEEPKEMEPEDKVEKIEETPPVTETKAEEAVEAKPDEVPKAATPVTTPPGDGGSNIPEEKVKTPTA